MTSKGLFRQAAIDAHGPRWHGRIVLTVPTALRWLTLCFVIFATLLIVFAAVGTYTRRTTVVGQVSPDAGLVKIRPSQAGTIVESRVTNGQHVNIGDVLFTVSGERITTIGKTQAAITEAARARLRSLRSEADQAALLYDLQTASLRDKALAYGAESLRLKSLIGGQKQRLELAEAALARYEQLFAQGFVTHEQVVAKRTDKLDQAARLDQLERERIVALNSRREVESERAALPLTYATRVDQLQQQVAQVEQELNESEARRQWLVTAPESGRIGSVSAHAGQIVDATNTLAAIVPDSAVWCAELYAPSRAIGFIKNGDRVRIRYQAFPYQKFGQYSGTVASISTTALAASETQSLNTLIGHQVANTESLYRVTVMLDRQSVQAYGEQRSLQAGMLLDADLMHESRRIFEWAFEPLISVGARL